MEGGRAAGRSMPQWPVGSKSTRLLASLPLRMRRRKCEGRKRVGAATLEQQTSCTRSFGSLAELRSVLRSPENCKLLAEDFMVRVFRLTVCLHFSKGGRDYSSKGSVLYTGYPGSMWKDSCENWCVCIIPREDDRENATASAVLSEPCTGWPASISTWCQNPHLPPFDQALPGHREVTAL